MTLPALDPIRAAAIENELAAIGTGHSRLQQHQRRARNFHVAVGSVAVAAMLTGAAVVVSNLPGETTIGAIGETVTGTYTGTASIELGPPPADARVVILDITCTEGGEISVPLHGRQPSGDAVGWNCGDRESDRPVHITDGKVPEGGSTSLTITADPGTVWSYTAQYGTSSITEWGVNANGQTYGVTNENGSPDLTPAYTTDGKIGYISGEEQWALVGSGYINVYESDGTTVIGQFPIGDVGNQSSSGENANGQTFGVAGEIEDLDLISTTATNGKIGYISVEEQAAFEGTGYLNVYLNDGTTVIGQFAIDDVAD